MSIIISAAISAFAGVPVARTVDVSATIKPIALECYAGETLDLSLQLAFGGAPLSTPSAAATIYWQTNGMSGAWWQTNLACSATGLVSGQWQPALPFGRVWFFVGVESAGLNYRIAGQCAVLQSPGGSPSTAVLPPPGGTLNLGDYTIIGSPWITSSDSAAAIASATAPIAEDVASLSSQLSLSSKASSNYTASVAGSVAEAATAATNYTDLAVASAAKAATNYTAASVVAAAQQSAADLSAASNALAQATATVAGSVAEAAASATNYTDSVAAPLISATNSLSQSIAVNAQQSAYDLAAASNSLAQATAALSQTVAANAQQSAYDLAAASNALAQSTAALSQTVAANAQQSAYDLAAASNALAQSTAALAQTVAANAQQSAYDLAAAYTALAQATSTVAGSVAEAAAYATNYTDSVAGSVAAAAAAASASLSDRIDGLGISLAASNTAFRLMSIDGSTYQDATGIVWRINYSTNLSPWYLSQILYTNGTSLATNEIPGVSSWSIDGDYLSGDPPQWIWTLRVPAGGSEYAQTGVAEDATPADMNLEFVLSGGDISSLSFSRTNVVTQYFAPFNRVAYTNEAPDTAAIRAEIASATNAVLTAALSAAMTTNDVCAIVTNTTSELSAWTVWTNGAILATGVEYEWSEDEGIFITRPIILPDGNMFDIYDGFIDVPSSNAISASAFSSVIDTNELVIWHGHAQFTRTLTTQNALGLARLIDLPPLTNSLPATYQSKEEMTNYYTIAESKSNLLTRAEAESGFTRWTWDEYDYGQPIYNNVARNWQAGSGIVVSHESNPDAYGSVEFYTIEDDVLAGTASRNLITPTKTSQLTNDGDGTNAFATIAITNGLATSAEVNSAATDGTNYTDSAIATADTTYKSFALTAPTNINQSVQYLNITAAEPSTLSVLLPEGDGTKDWLIYVQSVTNVSISLPAATWWMADVAFTNDIQGLTPTALYFSQIDTGLFIFSRQELKEVVTP